MKYRQKAEDTEYLKKRIAVSESYMYARSEKHGRVDACVLCVSLTCHPITLFLLTQSSPLTLLLFSPHFFLSTPSLSISSCHFFLLIFLLSLLTSFSSLSPIYAVPKPTCLLHSPFFSPSSFYFLLPPGVEAAERPDGGDEGSPGTEGHFTHGQGRECGRAAGGTGIHQSPTRISQSG